MIFMRGPYRGFRKAPLKRISTRVPAHPWRFDSILAEDLLKKRIGQYTGPVHGHECLAMGGMRLEFKTLSGKEFLLTISDDVSGKVLQRQTLGPGNSKLRAPENTEISILAYVISENMVRCSIIMEKKE